MSIPCLSHAYVRRTEEANEPIYLKASNNQPLSIQPLITDILIQSHYA